MSSSDEATINYVTACDAPFELVEAPAAARTYAPAEFRGLISVDTVHDGNFIPDDLLSSAGATRLQEDGTLWRHYVRERDWGANLVASKLAGFLGLDGYHRVNVARVVMDFNRFPGSTLPGTSPLDRLAINEPFSAVLSHDDKAHVLEAYYDEVSKGLESAITGKQIKLSIHTYDEHNVSLTQRPEVSLLTRSLSYQQHSRLPFGLFDPLFPDVLAECCATRILRDRIALTLERAGVIVEHNYPYCLPDGSIEVRAQVWYFFQHLRGRFENERPETRGDSVYEAVWHMLQNTNLRDAHSEGLFGYLHRFRRAPKSIEAEYRAAEHAYEAIASFAGHMPDLIDSYRSSPARPSTISIEVRKDLLWRFEGDTPVAPMPKNAALIAEKLAQSIGAYFTEDRPAAATNGLSWA